MCVCVHLHFNTQIVYVHWIFHGIFHLNPTILIHFGDVQGPTGSSATWTAGASVAKNDGPRMAGDSLGEFVKASDFIGNRWENDACPKMYKEIQISENMGQ